MISTVTHSAILAVLVLCYAMSRRVTTASQVQSVRDRDTYYWRLTLNFQTIVVVDRRRPCHHTSLRYRCLVFVNRPLLVSSSRRRHCCRLSSPSVVVVAPDQIRSELTKQSFLRPSPNFRPSLANSIAISGDFSPSFAAILRKYSGQIGTFSSLFNWRF